jgi:hypothetical protein
MIEDAADDDSAPSLDELERDEIWKNRGIPESAGI